MDELLIEASAPIDPSPRRRAETPIARVIATIAIPAREHRVGAFFSRT